MIRKSYAILLRRGFFPLPMAVIELDAEQLFQECGPVPGLRQVVLDSGLRPRCHARSNRSAAVSTLFPPEVGLSLIVDSRVSHAGVEVENPHPNRYFRGDDYRRTRFTRPATRLSVDSSGLASHCPESCKISRNPRRNARKTA